MEASLLQNDGFDYQKAFSRNLGWLQPEEQKLLGATTVGIVGMGGVGGQYSEILSRLGVQNFYIADFDRFSVENTNRQNECRYSNYDKNKAETMARLIQDINPLANVRSWNEGLREKDIDGFCNSIDIYLDGLDFFEINLRVKVFRKMFELGKPALTAAPVGCGTSLLIFDKDSMSFDEYFGIEDSDLDVVKYAKFLVGLDSSIHMSYLMDTTRFDLKQKKAPSLPMGVYSCASVMATTVLKLVLGRGPLLKAPYIFHFDPYVLRSKARKIHFGFRNPLQKLKLKLVLKRFAHLVEG
jgi:molybdopterin/thiamine biosynthesis adenylyltransferase